MSPQAEIKSPSTSPAKATRTAELVTLAVFVMGCLLIAALGGAATSTSVGGWYQTLIKPPFNPPDWIFAPVWTVLYVMMAVAAWRVWRVRAALANATLANATLALRLFVFQLTLNLLWSYIFFGLTAVGVALVEIVLLWVAIIATAICFARIDRLAAWLMAPYAAWVSFAMLLNASLWWLNR